MPKILTTKLMIDRFNAIWKSLYDYSEFEYIRLDVKSKIICNEHGVFLMTPNNHSHKINPQGCPKCAITRRKNNQIGKLKYSTNEIINQFKLVWNCTYGYDEFLYRGDNVKGKISCKKHGIFLSTPSNHKQGTGCPKCAKSSISDAEIKWLNSFSNEHITHQYRIYIDKNTYIIVDGYDPITNTVYEYHGKYWHGHPDEFPDSNFIHPVIKKPIYEIYNKTLLREKQLKQLGYNLITIWK